MTATTSLGYEIATPADWDRIPTTDQAGRAAIKAILDRQFAGRDDLPLLRINLQDELVKVLDEARVAGGLELYLSNMAIAGYPIPTSLVVSQLPGPAELATEDGIQALAAELRTMSDPTVTMGSCTVEQVQAGHAVRRETRVLLPGSDDDGPRESFGLQWWVPIPSADGGLLLLAFASPLLPLRTGLLELFDSIAHTLTWL